MFQRRSKFSSEISSGGSIFLEKLVPGGTNLGGSIFAVTGPLGRGILHVYNGLVLVDSPYGNVIRSYENLTRTEKTYKKPFILIRFSLLMAEHKIIYDSYKIYVILIRL